MNHVFYSKSELVGKYLNLVFPFEKGCWVRLEKMKGKLFNIAGLEESKQRG